MIGGSGQLAEEKIWRDHGPDHHAAIYPPAFIVKGRKSVPGRQRKVEGDHGLDEVDGNLTH